MNHSISQQGDQPRLTSESSALNAGSANCNTWASAFSNSDVSKQTSFDLLTKPFDDPMHGCNTSTGPASTALQTSASIGHPQANYHKEQSTHHVVPRPWAVQPLEQSVQVTTAEQHGPSQNYNPLFRWQSEPMVEGPYQMIGSIGRTQQNSSQRDVQGMPDTPSEVSAARGSFVAGRE
jgi:hypothetical protein